MLPDDHATGRSPDNAENQPEIRWTLADSSCAVLFGEQGLRLTEWLQSGMATIVKHGPHRSVYRVALPGLDVFVKQNRVHNTRAWLRQCFRPSKARIEYDKALALAARGIATITPLALGESIGNAPGDSYLVTRTINNAEALGAFLEQNLPSFPRARQVQVRQRLAVVLGRFVAAMHDAGVRPDDFHAGNLMVRLDQDQPQLFLIDLHAVHIGRPLSWTAARDNLVVLNRWFVMRVGRADRLRFWHAYHAARFSSDRSREERALDLEERTWISNMSFWEARDHRCRETNRYYRRVSSSRTAGHVVADLASDAVAALLADPDEPFHRPGVKLLKDSRSSTVAEVEMMVNGQPCRVIYKRFRVTSWTDPLTALLRRTPALRSWVWGHGLRERCLPTPRPLAVLHRRQVGLPREGYLLTEKVRDASELAHYVAGLESLDEPVRRLPLRCLIEQVAHLVRKLHARNLSHRDLKAANILVQRSGEDSPTLWLIDLVGVSRHSNLSRRRRVQNLARLNASFLSSKVVTRTEKLRFLRIYLGWNLFGKAGWKDWWRAIEEATRVKIARNSRNGRVLV